MIKLRFLIEEEKLSSVDIEDIVTDEFLNQHELDSGELEYLFDQYKYENEYIDKDITFDELSNDEDKMQDFTEWLRYEFEYRFNEQKELYERMFRNGNGKMTLFRAMTVSKSWIKSLLKPGAKLGIYWAYEENAAEPHWGYNSKGRTETAILQTSVTEDDVDWNGTFEANLHPSIGQEEKEIRLKENAKIPLEALWINNKEINLNKTIKSNIYRA